MDENIARNIVRDLRLDRDDVVLEIGPGLGALTRFLAPSVRRLLAYEIDERVVDELRRKFGSQGVTILHEDFLNVSLSKIRATYGEKLRVVGNIPYHLSSPIIFKSFAEQESLRDLTIMVQREVAQRIVAGPDSKEYGILAVMTRLHAEARILFHVSPNCFYPKPKVTSSVLTLTFKDRLAGIDYAAFASLVKTAFGKRRKTMRNSLQYLPYDEPAVRGFLVDIDKNILDKRPEQLHLDQFIRLTERLMTFIA